MRVELRRAQIRMPEHLLNAAKIRSPLEQVRRERMAEDVRVHALRVEACPGGEPSEDEERAGPRQASSLDVEEELRPVAAVEVRPPAAQVAAQRLDPLAPERHDSFLVALADAADEAALKVDGAAFEPDGLADPQPGAVEELDERAVTQLPRRRPVRGVDQPLDLSG